MSKKDQRSKESKKAGSTRSSGRANGLASHAPVRRPDEGTAFLPDPYGGRRAPARAGDPLAETLAEEYVASATSAEEIAEDDRDQFRAEELGGPFTETTAQEEFAVDPDESNPDDALVEPFPTATRTPG